MPRLYRSGSGFFRSRRHGRSTATLRAPGTSEGLADHPLPGSGGVRDRRRRERYPSARSKGGLTAPITITSEIARPAEEVFAYVTDPSTMPEWQQGCVRGHMDGPTTRVGSRCTTVRKLGGREREVTTEITEYDPPHRWADRGIDGPVRGMVAVTVEPHPDRSRSRLTIELDFAGHGIGKLLVPLLVRRQAASEMPENMRQLKQRLEARP